jgi:translocation and assembly module TamB
MEVDAAGINLKQFQLRTGKTIATATGRLGKKSAINWSISSPTLTELYPAVSGQFYVKGTISGPPSLPKLDASFNSKTFKLSGYKMATMNGKVSLDLFNWQQVNVDLAANELTLKEYELHSLEIKANNNKLQVKAKSERATGLFEFNGKLSSSAVQGSIDKADLVSQDFADWKLKKPVALKANKALFLLEPLCWKSIEGKACVILQKYNETWQSQVEIEKLPMHLLSSWLPVDIKAEGVTNINADLKFNQPDKLEGQAQVTLPPGMVSYPGMENKREQLKYRGGRVDVILNDKGLNATAELRISNENFFKGQLSLPAVNLFAINRHKQAIQANAQLNINDLTLIEAVLPESQNVKGELGFNFAISGTLAKPKLIGSTSLKNASFQVPRLGLKINQLSLISKSDGLEKLDFQIAAQSGEGHISIQGQTVLNSVDGWPTTLSIKGEKFEASHIPVSHLLVSPDLKITLQKRTINISGTVHIPYAKLQPRDVMTAVKVSDDTQIIGGEQVIEEKWLVHTKVRLTLGERVHFYGFGFDGRFAGSLLLQDEPGQLTKAVGEINVAEGRYVAYGQNLQVEHGRLLYTNGPVTNPGLDIRAVRQVGTITAGLKVRGTLNQPSIELFSNPVMGQTDTLAYLLLGRPIENATGKDGEMMAKAALALSLVGGDSLARKLGARFGLDEMRIESSDSGEQASLIIGRYLSPKLYVGYGVGLIESFNTFNVRYQISDKWQLKGESGENQGADLYYTIER